MTRNTHQVVILAAMLLISGLLDGGRAEAGAIVFFDDRAEPPNTSVTVTGWNDWTPVGNRTENMRAILTGFLLPTPAGASGNVTASYVLAEATGPEALGLYSDIVTFSWSTSVNVATDLTINLVSVDTSTLPTDYYGPKLPPAGPGPPLEINPFNNIPPPDFLPASQTTLVVRVASIPEPSPLVMAGIATVIGLGCAWCRRKWATA